MNYKMTMKICKTTLTQLTIDLSDWYDWEDLTEKEKFEKIAWIQDNPNEILEDGGIRIFDKEEEIEIHDWDIEES